MLKFYSLLIGENPEYTATFQPSSKRKIALYANCMLVPIILWFINGYLLVKDVLQESIWTALLTAAIIAFIIFLIERAVIMSNGSKWIAFFRVCLGLIVAMLGSIAMDEVVFKSDIDNKVAEYRTALIENAANAQEADYNIKIQQQQAVVDAKAGLWSVSLEDTKKEAGGHGVTGKRGFGAITKLNKGIADEQKSDYASENKKLEELKKSLVEDRELAKQKAQDDFNSNALLLRIRAMFDLIATDNIMMGVYILFTLFLFLVEFLVVIVKMCSKKSIDEELEEARISLLRSKSKKIMDRASVLYEVEQYIPSVQRANVVIKQNPASIFN